MAMRMAESAKVGGMGNGPVEGLEEGEAVAEGKDDFRDRPPSIWSEYWDEEVDASYYYNQQTGEATWIKPPDFDGEADYMVDQDEEGSVVGAEM